jgi:hypothetical protein
MRNGVELTLPGEERTGGGPVPPSSDAAANLFQKGTAHQEFLGVKRSAATRCSQQ